MRIPEIQVACFELNALPWIQLPWMPYSTVSEAQWEVTPHFAW